MSEHIRYQVFLGSKLIGEVYVLHDKHIYSLKKPKRGLYCRKVG